MKKMSFVLIMIFICAGCSKRIILKEARINQPGLFSYSKNMESNYFIDKNITYSFEKIWETETHGSFLNSSIVIYDKYLFAADLSGRLYCFDDVTGKEIGVEKFKGEMSISPVIEKNQIIFAVNEYKEHFFTLHFFNFIKGEYNESIEMDGSAVNEMIKLSDGVIILSSRGELTKLDYNGKLNWRYKSPAACLSDPFYAGGKIYFSDTNGYIHVIDAGSGKEDLIINLGGSFESGPVIKDKLLCIGNSSGEIILFDLAANETLWVFESKGKIATSPIFHDRIIIATNLSGRVMALSIVTGDVLWEFNANGLLNAKPLAFKNIVIIPDLNKGVYFINIESGELLNKIQFSGRIRHSPAYYNGKLYLSYDRGIIESYKINELNND